MHKTTVAFQNRCLKLSNSPNCALNSSCFELGTNDQSITSTKTKYIKLNTKNQSIFCHLNENLTTFFIHFDRSNVISLNWVLVFSFMYLVLVDAMV